MKKFEKSVVKKQQKFKIGASLLKKRHTKGLQLVVIYATI